MDTMKEFCQNSWQSGRHKDQKPIYSLPAKTRCSVLLILNQWSVFSAN